MEEGRREAERGEEGERGREGVGGGRGKEGQKEVMDSVEHRKVVNGPGDNFSVYGSGIAPWAQL